MKLKKDTKFRQESICCFKIGIRNLTKFDPSSLKSQKFHFKELLLSKVYIVWAKKVQRSYLSSSWKGIQNLESNRLVVSKLPSGIRQNLTRAVESFKNFILMSSCSAEYILFELKMYRGVISHETEKGYKI